MHPESDEYLRAGSMVGLATSLVMSPWVVRQTFYVALVIESIATHKYPLQFV